MFKLSNLLGARCSVLGLMFCFSTAFNSLLAQNVIYCGAPDMPKSEYQALFDSLGPIPAGAGSMTFNLPIWFNFVTGTTQQGETDWKKEFTPLQLLSEINGYFSSTGIQFYLCGFTQISNNQLVDLDFNSEASTLKTLASQQNSNYNNVINVFLVGKLSFPGTTVGGFYSLPFNGDVGGVYCSQPGTLGANTLSHELGHYLSMPHTFAWGPVVTDPLHPERAQYVEDEVTLMVNGVPKTFICEGPSGTGDGFCDTRADPTRRNIGSTCGFQNDCVTFQGCIYPNDPLGVPYDPDPSLLMGDYHTCSYRFSADQTLQMKMMLASNSAWAFLTDANEPTCQSLTCSDRGYLLRNCEYVPGANGQTPFKEFTVPFEDSNPQPCGSPVAITNEDGRYVTFNCVYPYAGNGLLSILPEIDHPQPLEGVTTYDLVLISKHILSLEPIQNPFILIGADVNNGGSVTSFDIVELRKLILGIYHELPNNSIWRFVPDYCFNDPDFNATFYGGNPFAATWENPDEAAPQAQRNYGSGALPTVPNGTSWMDHVTLAPNGQGAQNPHAWSFWGIKVGDVNCTADIDAFVEEDPDDLFAAPPHSALNTNQMFTLQIKVLGNTPVSAWQLGIDFAEDSLQIIQIQPGNSGEAFSLDNFGLTELEGGKLRALNFNESGAGTNLNGKTIFKLVIRALKPINDIGQIFRLKNSVLSEKFYAEDGSEIENMPLQLEVVTSLGMKGNGGASKISEGLNAVRAPLPYPVPFESEIRFNLPLRKEETVHLSIFDGFGRLVRDKYESLSNGPQSITIDNLAGLSSGLYWYMLEAEEDVFTGKIPKQ